MGSIRVRAATMDDETFLARMLYEAATWRESALRQSYSTVLARAEIAVYLSGWGREGDAGFIAEDDAGSHLGAAWYRVFSDDEHGFGFVSAEVPELTVAVESRARGQGVGAALLEALVESAKAQGIVAPTLSVEQDNPAVHLYERAGFQSVSQAGNALTMVREIADETSINEA
jgi:ribosomal protein S18 acetylase RimI-like enzyme